MVLEQDFASHAILQSNLQLIPAFNITCSHANPDAILTLCTQMGQKAYNPANLNVNVNVISSKSVCF